MLPTAVLEYECMRDMLRTSSGLASGLRSPRGLPRLLWLRPQSVATVSGLVDTQGLEHFAETENQTLPGERTPVAKDKQGPNISAAYCEVRQHGYYRAKIFKCTPHVKVSAQTEWVGFTLLETDHH